MQIRSRCLAAALAFLSLLALPLAPARARSDIGVVVLHGTQGFPGDRVMAPFERALVNAGYAIQAPQMCWSGTRIFDATYPDCLREIDAAVAALRAGGARRIVVAGQSRGGNAAIVYGVQHPELAGVIALAPASVPDQYFQSPAVVRSLAEARRMVAAGQGNQRAGFTEANVGRVFTVSTTAEIYLSFHEPGGPADFPKLLPQLRVPFLWVAGSLDRLQDQAPTWFRTVPANPLNKLVQVTADHLGTPLAGTGEALDWLERLPAQ
jgi:pimeloyl-ACP methyl ester carboxylesterase